MRCCFGSWGTGQQRSFSHYACCDSRQRSRSEIATAAGHFWCCRWRSFVPRLSEGLTAVNVLRRRKLRRKGHSQRQRRRYGHCVCRWSGADCPPAVRPQQHQPGVTVRSSVPCAGNVRHDLVVPDHPTPQYTLMLCPSAARHRQHSNFPSLTSFSACFLSDVSCRCVCARCS